MSTHEMVRAYIDEHGLCRKYIAANMGISDSKLSQLLNGKRRMTVDDYMTLCQRPVFCFSSWKNGAHLFAFFLWLFKQSENAQGKELDMAALRADDHCGWDVSPDTEVGKIILRKEGGVVVRRSKVVAAADGTLWKRSIQSFEEDFSKGRGRVFVSHKINPFYGGADNET